MDHPNFESELKGRIRTAAFVHKLQDGRIYEQCLRCNLKIDKDGNPDPAWYSENQIANFMAVSPGLRCSHNRGGISDSNLVCEGKTSVRTRLVNDLASWNVNRANVRAMLQKFDELHPEQAAEFEPFEKLYDRLKD